MYCSKCGKEAAQGIKFCPKCGNSMENGDAGAVKSESNNVFSQAMVQQSTAFDKWKEKLYSFQGRVNRKEYILSSLILAAVTGAAALIGLLLGDYGIYLTLVFLVPILISALSLNVRRLHDLNKSGWLTLILGIPLIGSVFGIYLLCAKGTDGSNDYGADPLRRGC